MDIHVLYVCNRYDEYHALTLYIQENTHTEHFSILKNVHRRKTQSKKYDQTKSFETMLESEHKKKTTERPKDYENSK